MMDYKTKSNLIAGLASEFTPHPDLRISTSNYISDTGSVDCSALGLPIDTLEKTVNVIEQHERLFIKEPDKHEASQYLAHIRVAKKCVEEVIALKRKKDS